MERWLVKVFILFGTFILPLLCTLLPYRLSECINRRGDAGKKALSYLMCLGGGIFFGTYLLHMGPEVRLILDESLLKPYNITYPLPDLIVGIGFFIVLFAEKLVLKFNQSRIEANRSSLCAERQRVNSESVRLNSVMMGDLTTNHCSGGGDSAMCKTCYAGLECSGSQDQIVIMDNEQKIGKIMREEDSKCPLTDSSCCVGDIAIKTSKEKERQIILSEKVEEKLAEIHMSVNNIPGGHHHSTRSIILILALSLHRIFEGMSVGLQKSTQDVLHLFLAVMCHETVIGFSLGLQFVRSELTLRRLLLTAFICSIIMPIGVAIGTAMTEVGAGNGGSIDIVNGVLQAIAMGTFIYVTFFEILQEELNPDDTDLAKICFVALGFFLMALLTLIPEEQNIIDSIHHSNGTPGLNSYNVNNTLV